ncbi:hypothetical protein [Nocardioides marmoribigeumensis]|jgi:hypothetical protein|uniref:Uncharacterized protein n=1 Tax=Nocardioides marmoribigeumensis TaxID=433649 RepID=A0ABU2BRS4_9ACTN|nr:hypothetical protein [Nocardioides marmoribigeumensis]MDR7361329.1 hypothetical protein [Nocardioides marmoribigeumensis]
MKTTPSFAVLAGCGAVLWFLAGFVQGGLRSSADPELVLGFGEAFRALGWVAVIGAALTLVRRT